MIEYITISYVVMCVWTLKWLVLDGEDAKPCIKQILIAPLSVPCNVIRKFINW